MNTQTALTQTHSGKYRQPDTCANIKEPFMHRHFQCVCLHVYVHIPVGLCLSVSVLLHLNLFRLWFLVTGVRGQLAQIKDHDPRWPRCQLDADKNGCTQQARVYACKFVYVCVFKEQDLFDIIFTLPILDSKTLSYLCLVEITCLNKINWLALTFMINVARDNLTQ